MKNLNDLLREAVAKSTMDNRKTLTAKLKKIMKPLESGKPAGWGIDYIEGAGYIFYSPGIVEIKIPAKYQKEKKKVISLLTDLEMDVIMNKKKDNLFIIKGQSQKIG